MHEWSKKKSDVDAYPTGALPVVTIRGERLCETIATLRFLSLKLGEVGHEYYPKTTDLQWQCNSIMDGFSELMNFSGDVVTNFMLGDEH